MFQANAGFCAEFLFMMLLTPWVDLSFQKISKLEYIVPSVIDYTDKILFCMGTLLTSASLPIMIRALVPAVAGYFSHLMFGTQFTPE